MSARRIAGLLLSAAVSIALLLLLMRGGSWAGLGASIARIPRGALAVYALVSAAALLLRALRFRLLLPAPRPATGQLLLATVVQNCLGDLVPGRLAALGSYLYLLVRRLGVGLEPAAAAFLLSVVFEIATLGPVLALAALVRLGQGTLATTLPLGWIVAMGGAFFLAAGVALREAGPLTGALARVVRGPRVDGADGAGRRRRELAGRLDALAGALGQVRRAGTLAPVFLLSLLIRLAKYASLYSLMTGLLDGAGAAGKRPDFWDLILGITATELVASLPIPALGQFGVWEGGMTGALLLLGVERGTATLAAVGVHGIAQAYEYLLGLAALGLLALTRGGAGGTASPRRR